MTSYWVFSDTLPPAPEKKMCILCPSPNFPILPHPQNLPSWPYFYFTQGPMCPITKPWGMPYDQDILLEELFSSCAVSLNLWPTTSYQTTEKPVSVKKLNKIVTCLSQQPLQSRWWPWPWTMLAHSHTTQLSQCCLLNVPPEVEVTSSRPEILPMDP